MEVFHGENHPGKNTVSGRDYVGISTKAQQSRLRDWTVESHEELVGDEFKRQV